MKDSKINDNLAFKEACHGGHLGTVRWLTDKFNITSNEAKINNNEAFRWTCQRGHLKVVQWFTDKFNITEN